jgi:hypothetical protein
VRTTTGHVFDARAGGYETAVPPKDMQHFPCGSLGLPGRSTCWAELIKGLYVWKLRVDDVISLGLVRTMFTTPD